MNMNDKIISIDIEIFTDLISDLGAHAEYVQLIIDNEKTNALVFYNHDLTKRSLIKPSSLKR